MSLLSSAVNGLKSEAEQFFGAVVTDVKTWAGDVETVVVDDAKVAWLALWPILSAVGPAQWKILQGLVNTANKDIAADDYTTLAQDVLTQAAAAELAWVTTMGNDVLLIIVTALRGSSLPATPVP